MTETHPILRLPALDPFNVAGDLRHDENALRDHSSISHDFLLRVAALAAVYYTAARIGLSYATIGHSISLVWPPTGVALAALAALGYRFWPGVALGAFLANASTPVSLAVAAGIAAGNTLEAL